MSVTLKCRWLICWVYAAGVLCLSLIPSDVLSKMSRLMLYSSKCLRFLVGNGCGGDKVFHALMYGGWAILLGWAMHKQMLNRPAEWMARSVLLALAYGALLEVLQGSLVLLQRSCSFGDLVANLAGAIMGIGFYAIWIWTPRLFLPAQY